MCCHLLNIGTFLLIFFLTSLDANGGGGEPEGNNKTEKHERKKVTGKRQNGSLKGYITFIKKGYIKI
jgi:hypothetical protein